MNLVYFLGRLHVLVLHLPIGILLAVLLLEWVARRKGQAHLKSAAPLLWGALALTSVITVTLGYLHFSEGGFSGSSANAHRLLGTSVALLAVLTFFARKRWPDFFERTLAASSAIWLVVITLTGHFGGNLTHGPEYLVEYAPQPLRTLLGQPAKRPPVTSLADADPFLDLIAPMLHARCSNCHNKDKRSGKFSVASYALVLKGGEQGPVIVKGDSAHSDLYRRITLPASEKEHMPAEGKTPLTADQIDIMKWWIDAGAPTDVRLGALKSDVRISTLIASALKLGSTPTPGTESNTSAAAVEAAPGAAVAADAALVEKLAQAGFVVRQVSATDAGLQLSLASPTKPLSDSGRTALLAAARNIVSLDLSGSQLTDQDVSGFSALSRLRVLELDNNALSSGGVAFLGGLEKLEKLNLHGNARIDDAVMNSLVNLGSLSHLYLWNTGVTARGVQRLKQLNAKVSVDVGDAAMPAALPPMPAMTPPPMK
jgi:uncharacterized membrane protein